MIVRIELEEGVVDIPYETVDDVLADEGLKCLFGNRLVRKAEIRDQCRRIAGLPATQLTWDRLVGALRSNRSALGRPERG